MIVHQVYAQINQETVQNIIVCPDYEMANYLARCAYGNTAFAVDCLQYPCQIGDKYIDGIFYSVDPETGDQTVIDYVPTQEQQVQQLQTEKEATDEYSIDLDYGLSCLELGI